MNLEPRPFRALLAAAAAGCLILGAAPTAGAQPPDHAGPIGGQSVPEGLPQLEKLDRGLVAVSTSEGVFVSWRLLASEVTGAGPTGQTGPAFVVSRDGEAIATVTDSTNFADPDGDADSSYTVATLVDGILGAASSAVSPSATGYHSVPLTKPADGVTPKGEGFTYSANDASVADVDGDGAYELIVKWDPSNSKDVSQVGYTGEVYLDTYEFDGTLLNRISLGVNIRAGAHYTQFLAYDFDGDGRSELMLKTAPGTKSTTYAEDGSVVDEQHVTIPERDAAAGVTHQDDYRMSNADFRAHLTDLFLGWHERPEVVSGQWPATLEEAWGAPVTHEYPLSQDAAEELTSYFIDVYAPSRSGNNRLWNFEGFIVEGPEYLTVFDGLTGTELETVDYKPGRGDDGLLWGDYAMGRIEPGNRVDRFLSGVAYLDGTRPSAVFARGYYTRSTIAAYNWTGERPCAADESLQRRSAWTGRHRPRIRHHHDSGIPFAQRVGCGPRRTAGDRLRLGHDRRRRLSALQLVRPDAAAECAARADGASRARRCDARDRYRSEPPGAGDLHGPRRWCVRTVRVRDEGCRERGSAVRRLHRPRHGPGNDRRCQPRGAGS
jgi:hypothetical protein